MTDDEIRLFNEIMQNQSGEQAEGLATRYPSVFEVPRIGDIPDPLNMRKRMEDSERRRKEAEEAAFQEQYGQKTILDMARPEFIPDDITQAIQAIGTVGSGAGAGIKSMVGEAFGMDPEAIMERNIYFPETVKKAQRGEPLTDEERRDLAFYGRYAGKIGEGIEKAEDVLAPVGRAYDASKLDALMFMPGTRNISMIDDIIEEGIGAARRAAPAAKMASEAAQMTAKQTADYVKELGATFDQLKPIVNLPNIQKMIREEFESPPIGAIAPDALGFSSRLSESVDKLQDKGTGPQFLAQLKKMKGVPQKEIEATGLDKYLQGAGKVTKEGVQDFLSTNRVEIIEDERFAVGKGLDDESKRILGNTFPWLEKGELDEEFEDLRHLRNTMYRALDRHIDDIEQGWSDGPRQSADDLWMWRDEQIDRIDTETAEFEDEIRFGGVDYGAGWMLPGGENYREILYKLPKTVNTEGFKVTGSGNQWYLRDPNDQIIEAFPSEQEALSKLETRAAAMQPEIFRPTHYTQAENTFGSIRATDRDIDGKPVLFAEEIQSDWAIKGAKVGYKTSKEIAERNAKYAELQAQFEEANKKFNVASERYNNRTPSDDGLRLLGNMRFAADKANQLREMMSELNSEIVPDNPFRGNWYKPVVNNFLVKAAKEGKQGIGFPTGEVVKNRYDLSTAVDSIEWSTSDDKKTVLFRNFGDRDKDNIEVDFESTTGKITQVIGGPSMIDWEGKNISDVIGKDIAQKLVADKSGVIDQEGLKIGGKGKDKLYDEMIPKHLKEIGDKYGVQLEKHTIPFGEKGATESEVYFFPITEEMRNDILSEGLPMFKQGGHVQKFAPGGKVMKGIAKGAKEASKAVRRQERVDKNLQSYVSGSKLVDVEGKPLSAYHGRQSIPFTVFDKSKIGSNTRQGNNAFWFTTNPNVAETFRFYGRRDADYASQINIDRILEKLQEDGRQSHAVQNYDVALGQDGSSVWARLINGPENKRQWAKVGVLGKDADVGLSQWAESVNKIPIRDADSLVEAYLRAQNPLEINFEGKLKTEPWSEIVSEAQRQGRDSVIFKNVIDTQTSLSERKTDPEYLSDIYGVFSPTQIKSATGNRGSFDPSDPDITKAKGGPIKSALEGVGKAAAEVKKTGKLTRLQKELRERGGEKQAQRLERAADEIPGLERLFHSRGLLSAFQGSEGYPYQGVVTMRPGDYKNWAQPLEVDLGEGRQGISPYSVQNIEDLRELIRRGRPFIDVPVLQLDKKGPLTIVSGHEGRHRTRAMEAENIPATLVQIFPRQDLKFKDSRNLSPSEWRQKLSEEIGSEGLVLPEGGMKFNPKFTRASELAKKASEERDWGKFRALDRELSRYYNEGIVTLPDLEMLTEFPEVYQKGGAVKSIASGAQRAAKEGQKMLQGVYRGYTGERLAEPVLSTTPQKRVAEYYANRRAAERGEDPHLEMLMVDPFAGKQYGLSLPIDQYNRDFITTRARAITPEDVAERIQLKKRGGLASLSR